MFHIMEEQSYDNKLLLLNHLYSDNYDKKNEEEIHAKAYFKKFIYNEKYISLVLNQKLQYFILNLNNKWEPLPSNKKVIVKDIYINKKEIYKNIGMLEWSNKYNRIEFKKKDIEDHKKSGVKCGTGNVQKGNIIDNNNKLFELWNTANKNGKNKKYVRKGATIKIAKSLVIALNFIFLFSNCILSIFKFHLIFKP